MRTYKLAHLGDASLLAALSGLVVRDRQSTAILLAHLAEVDARRLYAPAGFPSMFAYCVGELRLSEDAASKRIHAARAAYEFPILFEALADGRLHMSAVRLLAPHLNTANVQGLVAEATHLSRLELEQLLARRFPRAEELRLGDGVTALPTTRLVPVSPESTVEIPGHSAPEQHAPGHVPEPPTRLTPLSPERFALQITIVQATHDKLRYAQALLGHAVPSGDVALVLDRALDSLIAQLEKCKLAATRRPRRQPRPTRSTRHVPAHVRRAVWERDGAQCTFTSDQGHLCGARTRLEFDHVDPVAHGGRASVEGMRLRCQAHNQFEAEQVFGEEFMRGKRLAPDNDEQTLDVIAGLRALGMRATEARRLAEASHPDQRVSLEERLRLALQAHRPRRIVQAEGRAPVPTGTVSAPTHAAAGP